MRLICFIVILFINSTSLYAEGFLSRLLNKPVQGGVAVIALPKETSQPKVYYNNTPVLVIHEDNQQWIAIVGIALTTKAGKEHITVEGAAGTYNIAFTVSHKRYKEQHIKLNNSRKVNPLAEDETRIAKELALQQKAYRVFSNRVPSNLYLEPPVKGRLSSPFGLRRFFNGQERNPHSGLDLAVAKGTPIQTPAAGEVILIGNYFFNGNTVFVDHGQGFISMFCHMSEITVKQGQQVKRGDTVGKVGATGRATGPHLHWNISLNDTRVDPAIFLGRFQP